MRYLTELHAHTSEVSECGHLSAKELVALHRQAGFHTIVTTDHCCAGANPGSAAKRTDAFLKGYRMAKEAGDKAGLNVLLGMEARLFSGPEDYLLFGFSEADVPALIEAVEGLRGLKEFYAVTSRAGFLLIQAHPYRYESQPGNPEYLDGYEVFNRNPRHDNRNEKTRAFVEATGKTGLILTAGSDVHREEDVSRTGIVSGYEIKDNPSLTAFLRKHPIPEYL